MVDIRKIRKSTKCSFCDKKAVKAINGLPFCPHCLDARLIRIMGVCSKAATQVTIKFRIIPKGI
jgi:hypothetical protein